MPASTGLSQLGDQLLRASGDYANMTVRKQREDEARAQALADLADQRRYTEGRNEVARGQRMEDTAQLAAMNSRFEALQRAQKLGLIAATDIGNMEIENMALKALAQREQAEDARKEEMRKRAQIRVDKNAATAKSIMDKISEAEQVANSQPEISPTQLRAEQERLARQANPEKKQISQADIDGQYNAALEKLNKDVMMDWAKNVQEAKISVQNNKMLLRSLADENQQLTQMFGVIGDVPETIAPAAISGLNPPAPVADPMAKLKEAFAVEAARKKTEAVGAVAQPQSADPSGGYGGVLGAVNSTVSGIPNALDTMRFNFSNAVAPVARGLNYIAGGEKRVQEGDAERAARY